MAETTTGQAIALGNIARPDTTKVFTQAVMRKQEMDLRKKKLEQDEAAKQKQLQAEFAKMLDFGRGGFLPMYQEQATEITSAANAEIFRKQKEGNIIEASAISEQAKRSLEDLEKENEQFKAWLSTSRQNGLIPQEVFRIANMPFSKAQQEFQKLVVNKPEVKEVFDINIQNKKPVYYSAKEVDYNSKLNSTTSNLLANSSRIKYDKRGNSIIELDYNVDDNIIANRAKELAADNDLRINIILTRPQDYRAQFDKVVAENKYDITDPDQRDLAKGMAVTRVIQNDIKVGIDKVRIMNQSKGGKGGDGDQIITTVGGGGGNRVPIKTKKIVGYEFKKVDGKDVVDYTKPKPEYVDENVNAGERRSFKTVKILAGKGDNYLDLDVNERMGGKAIQETEIGNIRVYPIATEDIKVGTEPNTFVIVKKGDVITENDEKLAKTKGLLRYEPRFEGMAIVKDNIRGEIRKSVLVDLNEAYGAVRSSQTKDDVPLVDLQVKEAQAEANRLNSGLPRLKAATTAPKTEAPKGKGAAKETKVAGKVNNKL